MSRIYEAAHWDLTTCDGLIAARLGRYVVQNYKPKPGVVAGDDARARDRQCRGKHAKRFNPAFEQPPNPAVTLISAAL